MPKFEQGAKNWGGGEIARKWNEHIAGDREERWGFTLKNDPDNVWTEDWSKKRFLT